MEQDSYFYLGRGINKQAMHANIKLDLFTKKQGGWRLELGMANAKVSVFIQVYKKVQYM